MFKNNFWLFLLFVSLTLLLNYSLEELLNLNSLALNSLAEQITREALQEIITLRNKWQWVSYSLIPLLILIRAGLVALCLNVGTFLYDMELKIPFKRFFRIALLGEFILVLVGYIKLGYFYFIKTDYTLQDLQHYYPLSYINLIDLKKIEPWLIYPIQTINLFEIAYFFILAFGMYKLLKNKFWESFGIVGASYGTGLIIWLGLVMFLTLNYT